MKKECECGTQNYFYLAICSIRCVNQISYPSSHIVYYTVNKCPEAEFYGTQTMSIVDLIEYIYCTVWVHNSLYPPSFQGLLEFCSQAQSVISFTYFIRFVNSFTLWIITQEEDTNIHSFIVFPSRQTGIEVVNDH